MELRRPATGRDRDLLREATLANVNSLELRFTADDLDRLPRLAHYYRDFPGPSDYGIVAERKGRPVGVVWAVHFRADDPGYGFVREGVPELSISVFDGFRGEGIGSRLLHEAVEEARGRGLPGLSLSVEDGNPARRLYERHGFRTVGREGNAATLLLELPHS